MWGRGPPSPDEEGSSDGDPPGSVTALDAITIRPARQRHEVELNAALGSVLRGPGPRHRWTREAARAPGILTGL